MKFTILIAIFLLTLINSCGLFQNNNESDYGHCDKELFEQMQEDGSLRVIAEYDMDYTPEDQLSEEEKKAQREAIAEMHDRLLSDMEGMNISGVNTLTGVPRIAMGVDERSLTFLCNSKLVKLVRLERVFQTN